ncbi:hypothetical protein AB6N23_08010 [Cellulomonas sp. 179-A 9B4 NHS]|uniref:hypothetical protein n=1 Tax=Cellulomonas sp. 179-A 9B4 NHS TaxID=3142379 RepID=UPI0039A1CC81
MLAATASACVRAGVDAASLPGEYVADGDGAVVLAADGTFTASDVPALVVDDAGGGQVDLSGTWEPPDGSGRDFVYLTIEDLSGTTSRVRGVQLYVSGDAVVFHPDPDSTERFVYERAR